ncbi:MAG: class II aldolase/adducin family protein [Pelolinea sp.]|nr:class II aldolase/adducin family protein [Pelolinea sp.]
MEITTAREVIAEFGAELYRRFLTDSTGGNLSIHIDDTIIMTPRFAGARWHWQLKPNQILVLDLEGNILDGDGEISREARAHFTLLQHFYPEAAALLHTHPRHIMTFCAAEQPIPAVLECTKSLGTLELCRYTPSESQALAEALLEFVLVHKNSLSQNGAIACMAPRHGLFVLARDIYTGYEVTERLDGNAFCVIHAEQIGGVTPINQSTTE